MRALSRKTVGIMINAIKPVEILPLLGLSNLSIHDNKRTYGILLRKLQYIPVETFVTVDGVRIPT